MLQNVCYGSILNYFSFENLLDLLRIGLLFICVFTDWHKPDVYMYLVFFSIFGLLNYLRMFKNLRAFIELFKECFKDMFDFLIIFVTILLAFNVAFYVRNS